MRNIQKQLLALLIVAGLWGLNGCGYSINQPGEMPGNVQTVYVNVFDNLTSEVGLETMIATSIVSEISRFDAKLVTARSDQADAIVRGTIRATSSQSIAKHGVNVAAERLAVLYVDVQLVDKNGMVLWQVRNLSDSEPYLVFGDKINNEASKYNAYGVIAARLAERVYNQMTDKF